MNQTVIDKCNLLIKNRDLLHAAFKWNGDLMMLAGSSFYVGLDKEIDVDKMKECEAILKDKTSILSEYRSNVEMPLLCKMAVSENPEEYFETIDYITQELKVFKWSGAAYRILAAMTICDHASINELPSVINKMQDIYSGMKEDHPFITGSEDVPFAAMLALTDVDTNKLLDEMENCYEVLKGYFHEANAIQSLSHVLSVDTKDTNVKCQKVIDIFELLKENKHKYGSGYELAVLGTMSVLDVPVHQIVEEIIDADEYLKTQKGFGNLNLGERYRRMYAAMMVMDAHMPPATRTHETAVDSMLTIVITIEICMIIMMTSMMTSSAAAH